MLEYLRTRGICGHQTKLRGTANACLLRPVCCWAILPWYRGLAGSFLKVWTRLSTILYIQDNMASNMTAPAGHGTAPTIFLLWQAGH